MIFTRKAHNAKQLAEIQSDYERTFTSPAGRRVFADLALMWGFLGADTPGALPEYREAFIWILDRMGINHVDNLDVIANAILQINRIVPVTEAGEGDE
jgi:hypothetical protein